MCGVVCLGMCVHARAKNLSARVQSSSPHSSERIYATATSKTCKQELDIIILNNRTIFDHA